MTCDYCTSLYQFTSGWLINKWTNNAQIDKCAKTNKQAIHRQTIGQKQAVKERKKQSNRQISIRARTKKQSKKQISKRTRTKKQSKKQMQSYSFALACSTIWEHFYRLSEKRRKNVSKNISSPHRWCSFSFYVFECLVLSALCN